MIPKASLVVAIFVVLYSCFVFVRLTYVQPPFSYDYENYLLIIDRLSNTSLSDMISSNFIFPYVIVQGIVPLEVGFSLLVVFVMKIFGSPEITFALIASASVGLRVYVMESLRVPRAVILVLNIFAITLLEANALRLGVASSISLFGLYQLRQSRTIIGGIAAGVAVSIHLQLVIFFLPFYIFFFLSRLITQSKRRIVFFLSFSILASLAFVQVIPFIANSKVEEYVARGSSGAAGLTITSVLAIAFLVFSTLAIRKNSLGKNDTKFWAAIVSASVPSVFLFTFLTNVAVIGDRAWQLSFLVLATFFFSNWASVSQKKIPLVLLLVLILTSTINVTVRYPLSNFWSPPFPRIETA